LGSEIPRSSWIGPKAGSKLSIDNDPRLITRAMRSTNSGKDGVLQRVKVSEFLTEENIINFSQELYLKPEQHIEADGQDRTSSE
jgi:hypothetical protein